MAGRLLIATTFVAWAGAMYVVCREARLTTAPAPSPSPSPRDLAIDFDLALPRLMVVPSPPPRAPEAASRPEPPPEAYDETTSAAISGEVVDRDGQPMKTAILTARCTGHVYERDISASSFSLTVAPGMCTVFAADQFGRSQSRTFSVGAGDSVSITLAPRGLDDRPIE